MAQHTTGRMRLTSRRASSRTLSNWIASDMTTDSTVARPRSLSSIQRRARSSFVISVVSYLLGRTGVSALLDPFEQFVGVDEDGLGRLGHQLGLDALQLPW
jgi:hypothetical protein